jgi:hypothetical protein
LHPQALAESNTRNQTRRNLEEKIVQQAVVYVLEAIYEEDFLGFAYGYRPERGQHRRWMLSTPGFIAKHELAENAAAMAVLGCALADMPNRWRDHAIERTGKGERQRPCPCCRPAVPHSRQRNWRSNAASASYNPTSSQQDSTSPPSPGHAAVFAVSRQNGTLDRGVYPAEGCADGEPQGGKHDTQSRFIRKAEWVRKAHGDGRIRLHGHAGRAGVRRGPDL